MDPSDTDDIITDITSFDSDVNPEIRRLSHERIADIIRTEVESTETDRSRVVINYLRKYSDDIITYLDDNEDKLSDEYLNKSIEYQSHINFINMRLISSENNFLETSTILVYLGFTADFVSINANNYNRLTDEQSKTIGDDYNTFKELSFRMHDISPILSMMLTNTSFIPGLIPRITKLIQQMGLDVDVFKTKLLYQSGRPKSDMNTMVNLIPSKLPDLDIIPPSTDVLVHTSLLDITSIYEKKCLFPVIRYGKKDKGMYMSDKKSEYCGKFYYYEPGSNIYLESNKTLFSQNKFTAMLKLYGYKVTLDSMRYSLDNHGKFATDKNSIEYLSIGEYLCGIIFNGKYKNAKDFLDDMNDGKYNFREYNSKLYAVEDRFDQLLCRAGKEQGIDVMVFTMMTGTSRLVSEILDVRSNTYKYLTMKH